MTSNPYLDHVQRLGLKPGDSVRFTEEALLRYSILRRRYSGKILKVICIKPDGLLAIEVDGFNYDYPPILFEKV